MNNNRVTLLLESQKLCNIVINSVNHLINNPSDTDVKEQLINTFKNISNSLKNEFADELDVLNLLNKTTNILNKDITDYSTIKESIYTLITIVSTTIAQHIYNEIQTVKHIEKSLSNDLLTYISSISCYIENIENLFLDICIKSSITNPLNAYNSSLELLTKFPKILSSKGYGHPEYEFKQTKQRTFKCCPICHGEGKPYFNAFAYRMVNFDAPHLPFKLWMSCNNCSNLYAYRYPEELLELSDNSTLITPDSNEYLSTTDSTSTTILSDWASILERLSTYTSGKRLLEVGIGKGELIAVALELGYDVNAVELMPSSAKRVSNMLNVPIYNGDFLNYTSEEKYSIITMGDVIEHVTSPEDALKNAYNLLEDGGVLWVSTPNYESAFSRIKKFDDPMWLTSNHITYFSYIGFANLAEKCNFKIVDYQISRRYNGSMELILVKELDK